MMNVPQQISYYPQFNVPAQGVPMDYQNGANQIVYNYGGNYF